MVKNEPRTKQQYNDFKEAKNLNHMQLFVKTKNLLNVQHNIS